MKLKTFHKILVGLLLIFVSAGHAQGGSFLNLTTRDGFSHNTVRCLFEDSKGYMWFGTGDGLCRYNGYSVEVFKNTTDKTLFPDNEIQSIAEDANHHLWIASDHGISILDLNTKQFRQIYVYKGEVHDFQKPDFIKIIIDSLNNQIVCISRYAGIFLFGEDYFLKGTYMPPTNFTVRPVLFNDGIVLDSLHYVFATSMGLVEFNLKTDAFRRILPGVLNYSHTVLIQPDGRILAVQEKGLAVVNTSGKGINVEYTTTGVVFPYQKFASAAIAANGKLWLGSQFQGVASISYYNLLNKKPGPSLKWVDLPDGLEVTDIHISKLSNGWVSTNDNGIFRFGLSEAPFQLVNAQMNIENGISTNKIDYLHPLDDHRVLISSLKDGQTVFNTNSGKFEPSAYFLPEIHFKKPLRIFVDSQDNTWVKYDGNAGLFRIKKGENKLNLVKDTIRVFPYYVRINMFTEDAKGNIWMGCEDGVFKITLNSNNNIVSIESTRPNRYSKRNGFPNVETVFVDTVGNCVWAGTQSNGLLQLTFPEDSLLRNATIRRFQYERDNEYSLSANEVSSILRLGNKQLWIGTEGGGICLLHETDSAYWFERYAEKDGLTNNLVKKILPGSHNQMWIATHIGLSLYNTKTKRFQRFSLDEGLPFENFNNFGVALENGVHVLAGSNGLCYFSTDNIKPQHRLPRLELSRLQVNNMEVLPAANEKERSILSKPLDESSEVELKHNENIFSIELTSLHFSNVKSYKIRYRLEPLNKEWIEVSSDKQIVEYNGISPGDYEFFAQASNSIDEWTSLRHLHITVKPPFWLTPAAFVIYVLFLFILIAGGVSYLLKMQELKHNLQLEKLEKERSDDVNRAKLRYFSNISHEIKTPITLLSGPTHFLLHRFRANPDVKEKLGIIDRQSKKIMQLISQVNDFQRADANLLEFHPSTFQFNQFIKHLLIDYEFMAFNDVRQLNVAGDENIWVKADKDKLEKILNNLLNNAFKFTGVNDTISLRFKKNDKVLEVEVADTGKGIHPQDLPYIFDRFYQSKNEIAGKGGSGIGLAFAKRLVEMHRGSIQVESNVEKGAVFRIELPVVTDAPPEDSIRLEEELLLKEDQYKYQNFIPDEVDVSMISVDEKYRDKTIFIAEDSGDMLQYLQGLLSLFFNVKAFPSAIHCLEAMKKEWPDLVISDVLMPGINGFELCNTIKSDRKTSHIPVILLTACATNEDQVQGIKYGADDYIRKPFDLQYLVTRMVALIKNREVLHERFHSNYPLAMKEEDVSVSDREFLDSLYALMSENIENPDANIDDFARKILLTRTRFYQKVKDLTNETPNNLFKNFRLIRASELLQEGKYTVNEIIVMTGFKSRAHFGRLFKERFNKTPKEYKNSKQLEEDVVAS